jgi:acyl-coenzyme A thioesterase PaaI-like protein
MVESNTHLSISKDLVGKCVNLATGLATVELMTTTQMAADAVGLVHGGFIFGLADYAAMLAVNDPNVVLGSASTKFTAPVRVGAVATAVAEVIETTGRRREVAVSVTVDEKVVFTGSFMTFVLDRHVLSSS